MGVGGEGAVFDFVNGAFTNADVDVQGETNALGRFLGTDDFVGGGAVFTGEADVLTAQVFEGSGCV